MWVLYKETVALFWESYQTHKLYVGKRQWYFILDKWDLRGLIIGALPSENIQWLVPAGSGFHQMEALPEIKLALACMNSTEHSHTHVIKAALHSTSTSITGDILWKWIHVYSEWVYRTDRFHLSPPPLWLICYTHNFFPCIHKFAKSDSASSCPSVCMKQLSFHWTDFDETWYLSLIRKSIEKIQVSLKPDKN
jgi:hypothetical protein